MIEKVFSTAVCDIIDCISDHAHYLRHARDRRVSGAARLPGQFLGRGAPEGAHTSQFGLVVHGRAVLIVAPRVRKEALRRRIKESHDESR